MGSNYLACGFRRHNYSSPSCSWRKIRTIMKSSMLAMFLVLMEMNDAIFISAEEQQDGWFDKPKKTAKKEEVKKVEEQKPLSQIGGTSRKNKRAKKEVAKIEEAKKKADDPKTKE